MSSVKKVFSALLIVIMLIPISTTAEVDLTGITNEQATHIYTTVLAKSLPFKNSIWFGMDQNTVSSLIEKDPDEVLETASEKTLIYRSELFLDRSATAFYGFTKNKLSQVSYGTTNGKYVSYSDANTKHNEMESLLSGFYGASSTLDIVWTDSGYKKEYCDDIETAFAKGYVEIASRRKLSNMIIDHSISASSRDPKGQQYYIQIVTFTKP